MIFEWNTVKAESNFLKHGIRFEDATEIFEQLHLDKSSDYAHEERRLAISELSNQVITVIYMKRGDAIRLISARRARENEKREYCALLVR
jgi:uncharacterized protein